MGKQLKWLILALATTVVAVGLSAWVNHNLSAEQRCSVGVYITRHDSPTPDAIQLPPDYIARFPESMKGAFKNATDTGFGVAEISEEEFEELRRQQERFDPNAQRRYNYQGNTYDFLFVMC